MTEQNETTRFQLIGKGHGVYDVIVGGENINHYVSAVEIHSSARGRNEVILTLIEGKTAVDLPDAVVKILS